MQHTLEEGGGRVDPYNYNTTTTHHYRCHCYQNKKFGYQKLQNVFNDQSKNGCDINNMW